VAAVGMCARAGVTALASFILGLPGETPDTLHETRGVSESGCRNTASSMASTCWPLSLNGSARAQRRAGPSYPLQRLVSISCQPRRGRDPIRHARQLDAIAVEWEERFDRYLGEIKARMQTGKASADEAHQVTNLNGSSWCTT